MDDEPKTPYDPADPSPESLDTLTDGTRTAPAPPLPRRRRWRPWLVVGFVASFLVMVFYGLLKDNSASGLLQIVSFSPSAAPTQTLTLSPTPSPSLTSTPSPTATLTPSVTPTSSQTPTPTVTLTPTTVPTFTPAAPGFTLSLQNIGEIQSITSLDYHGYLYDLPRAQAFSPDGALMALSDRSGLRLWRTSDWALLNTLEGGDGYQPGALAFSPDGAWLASTGFMPEEQAGTRVWWVSGGVLGYAISGLTRALAFSPDGSLLALADESQVRLFSTARRETLQVLSLIPEDALLSGPLFSPGGRFLAVSGTLNVAVWDVSLCPEAGGSCANLVKENPLPENRFERYLAFTPDETHVVYAGQVIPLLEPDLPVRQISALKYWMPAEGHLMIYPELARDRFGFFDLDSGTTSFFLFGWRPGLCVLCPFSINGELFVKTRLDEQVRSYIVSFVEVRTGKEKYALAPGANLAAHYFSPDGRFVFVVEQVEAGMWDKFNLQIWGLPVKP